LVHRRCGTRIERLVGRAAEDAAFRQELVSNVAGAVLDPRGGFVFRQGTAIRRIAPDGKVSIIANGLARENFGIALDRDGSILVAEAAARRIVRIGQRGARSIAATSMKPWSPTGVAVARGKLYVLEATDYQRGVDTRMRVRRIAPNRTSTVMAVVTIPPP
jgi:sugar lactone lactonase YvrE